MYTHSSLQYSEYGKSDITMSESVNNKKPSEWQINTDSSQYQHTLIKLLEDKIRDVEENSTVIETINGFYNCKLCNKPLTMNKCKMDTITVEKAYLHYLKEHKLKFDDVLAKYLLSGTYPKSNYTLYADGVGTYETKNGIRLSDPDNKNSESSQL
jgi:hypothetical protein